MQITITRDDLYSTRDEGTVVVFTGTDEETGDKVSFGADHRPAQELYDAALEQSEPVVAEVDDFQVLRRVPLRKGRIARTRNGNPDQITAGAYLPANYKVTGEDDKFVYFAGHDRAGWTLEDYVIPRLASGMHWAEEVPRG
jgi:hypothetical protein